VGLGARIDNGIGVDDDEQGRRSGWCARPAPWSEPWPQLRVLG